MSDKNDRKWFIQPKENKSPAEKPFSRNNTVKSWKPPNKFRTVSLKTIAELLDTTRLAALGWQPRISLREGLAATYQEFLEETRAGALRRVAV